MFIQYEEYQLLELFEDEPVAVADEEAGIFIYSKKDDFGFELVMFISIYEYKCNLSLVHQKYGTPIFDLELKSVKRIIGNNKVLRIERSNGHNHIEVTFKPNFALNIVNL